MQPFCDVANFLVIFVVRCGQALGVAALEVALPELCTHRE
jgi:hypothetical protein